MRAAETRRGVPYVSGQVVFEEAREPLGVGAFGDEDEQRETALLHEVRFVYKIMQIISM